MRLRRTTRFAAAAVFACAVGPAQAGVVEFFDKDEWVAAVGEFATIDFTEFPKGTLITDQYADLGVLFTDGDDIIYHTSAFVNDGVGLNGWGDITLSFEAPQLWIAVDYPGVMQIELYSDGQLIYTSDAFGGGTGNFLGLTSTEFFDSAVLIDPLPFGFVYIDDLHFGVPGPSGLALLALFALRPRRRRFSSGKKGRKKGAAPVFHPPFPPQQRRREECA